MQIGLGGDYTVKGEGATEPKGKTLQKCNIKFLILGKVLIMKIKV